MRDTRAIDRLGAQQLDAIDVLVEPYVALRDVIDAARGVRAQRRIVMLVDGAVALDDEHVDVAHDRRGRGVGVDGIGIERRRARGADEKARARGARQSDQNGHRNGSARMKGEGGFGTHRARGGDVRARRSSQCRPRARGRQGGVGWRGPPPFFPPCSARAARSIHRRRHDGRATIPANPPSFRNIIFPHKSQNQFVQLNIDNK